MSSVDDGIAVSTPLSQCLARPNAKAVRPIRVMARLAALLLLTAVAYVIVLATLPLRLVLPKLARRIRRWVALQSGYTLCAITGMRLEVHGTPPKEPYFLVSNHVVWLDGFAMSHLAQCTYIGMAEIQKMPIVRTIIGGVEPIYVHRKKEDTPRVLGLMAEVLKKGGSLFMCPEAVISPGREVRRFRGGLLQAAVDANIPVHYVSVMYRTPDDTPPPSKCILFGPDPYYLTPDGKIPPEELEAWGSEPSAWRYLTRFLSVSSYTVVLRFGEHPVHPDGLTKYQLADALCNRVREIFTPVE